MDEKECKKNFLNREIDHVDVSNNPSLHDLLTSFQATSYQSRNLAECLEVYENMLADETAVIILGLSGALVPGGMRKIITDMVRKGLIDVLVTTGANLCHDYIEASGTHHYVGSEHEDDTKLRKMEIDRIYDTYLDDVVATEIDAYFGDFAETLEKRVYSSREFLQKLGESIDDSSSILRACADEGVPIYCPALYDSGIGIGLALYYARHRDEEKFMIDFAQDNNEIMEICLKAENTGVFFLGGGVPKNYVQQIQPMLFVSGHRDAPGHKYAIQITTDDPKWGGLSGCTFSEAKSWGKVAKQARTATAYVDCTIGLPFVVGAVLGSGRDPVRKQRANFTWKKDRLANLSFA